MYLLSSATASETTLIAGKFVNYGKSYAGTFSGGTTYLSGGSSYQEKLLGGVMEVRDTPSTPFSTFSASTYTG